MAETTNKCAEVEIIGAAAESSESEIARLTAENKELKARVETLTRDRDQYLKWWGESNSEKNRLLNVTKSLVAYSGLI
ncbi:hypothetical protein [Muribaculum sp.]|uniref:hypothetical protein n=1 Tax=Muribaculum sp. TaxID=1918611 RepID=UPI0025868A0A|nr:hypothetical protein [Muribaculum sp.]MCX4277812.1 hypothetical protein [Muribaculum sp.]